MHIPDGWIVVLNHSKNYNGNQNFDIEIAYCKNSNKIINLGKKYLSERELSLLFYASNTVLLPYEVSSGSGVMFDEFAHGIPFIAFDLGFFKEFSKMNLGVTVERKPQEFVKALKNIDKNYLFYISNIERFKMELDWNRIANQHLEVYNDIIIKILSPNQITSSSILIQR